MKQFQGFPARTEFTPVPNAFFSGLLPQIDDISELKTVLHVMAALYRKKGYPRYVTFNQLAADAALAQSLKCGEEAASEILKGALKSAGERGIFLRVALDGDEGYLLNDEPGRQAVAKIESGTLKLDGYKAAVIPAETAEMPDIFTFYEQNIGMLTPVIADVLKDAEKDYPPDWIRDAIKEAVLYNKRNIKYIIKILENWTAEGKTDGTHRQGLKKTDPDRFIKGKYGHMVQR